MTTKMKNVSRATGLTMAMALLLLSTAGCLQIETKVSLHPDGSATVTERFQLSNRLLEFKDGGGAPSALAAELEKDAALRRMKFMGKGVTLVSHKTRPADGGGQESVAVFKVADIRQFQYASPFVGMSNYPERCMIKYREWPMLQTYHPHSYAGSMGVAFDPVTVFPDQAKKAASSRNKDKTPPKEPSPAALQALRQLQPVVRDMFKDFKLKFTFESYASIRNPTRGKTVGTREFQLLNVTDRSLDRFGGNFFENEEVMLEIQRAFTNGPNIIANTKGSAQNLTSGR